MTTKHDLENALKDAMRSNDDVSRRTIRMALTNIKLSEVDKGQPLDETGLNALLQKEIKSRREAMLEAQKANRPDLVDAATAEIAVIERFLPKGLSESEIRAAAAAVITEVGASVPTDMGKVMKLLLPRLQGRAPNDLVSQVVKQLLQNQG